MPRPFLKWVGGKRQLLRELLAKLDTTGTLRTYHEPFVGGGALFFELSRLGRLTSEARLADTNFSLIEAYRGVRDQLEDVIPLLEHHAASHSDSHYYETRAQRPESTAARAARIIYLNKTAYNGLFRENRSGDFNVPIGRYEHPTILDESNLRACSAALQLARVTQASFEAVLDSATAGDFVYFDPPYHPLSATASFTSYSKNGFGADEQRRLRDVFGELDRRAVRVMLSNSSTDFIARLYAGFRLSEVLATRAVNSNPHRRGKVAELIVTNF